MEESPGVWGVLSQSSFDVVWTAAILVAAAWYLRNVRRLAATRPRVPHPWWRTASFLAALFLVAVAVMSPVHEYGDRLLWVNFTGFLALTMLAPPLLVLGAPLTRAFRTSTPAGRRRLRALYRSRAVRFITFPVAIWLAFAMITYVWQFSSLTEVAARQWVVRDVQQATLLAVGVVFWYVALAIDPVFWLMAYPLRVLFVGLEMVHKGLFGGMFLSMANPVHEHFVRNAPAWGPNAMTDQRMAILILWIGGNLVFLAAIIWLINGWLNAEARNQRRIDHRLERAKEAERRRRAALDQVFSKTV